MPEDNDLTVLIVEDDPNHQLLIRRALTREGSAFSVVQFARDSREAERFAKAMSFDCILMDNRIPGQRGLDLIGRLQDEGVDAPFVLMTSAGSEDLVVEAYRKNVVDYVIKETGFWNDLPKIVCRVIAQDQARKREVELRDRLARTNEKLDALNTAVRLRNQQLMRTQRRLAEVACAIQSDLQAPLADLKSAVDTLAAGATNGDRKQPIAALRSSTTKLESAVARLASLADPIPDTPTPPTVTDSPDPPIPPPPTPATD